VVRALEARERVLTGVIGGLESFVTVDEKWIVTFANAAAATMAGLPEDEIVGSDFRSVLLPILGDSSLGSLEAAMSADEVTEFELADEGRRRVYAGRAGPLADGGLAVYLRDVSAPARGAEAALKGEAEFMDLAEGANSAILRWDVEGVVTFANRSAERLFGWDRGELAGQPVTVLVPLVQAVRPRAGGPDLQFFADPGSGAATIRENLRKDGGKLWVAWTNKVLRDEIGRVREVLAIGNDVSALMDSRAGFPEAEMRFRAVVQTTDQGIVLEGAAGTIVFVNHRMAEMIGYEPDDLVGSSTRFFTIDKRRPVRIEAPSLKRGQMLRGETRFRRRDGSTLSTRWRATPMLDSSDRHVGNLVMYTDITGRDRQRGALRESEARYRDLFESMQEGFALCELVRDASGAATDFSYQDVNPALEGLLQMRPGELRGRLHSEVLHADLDSLRWYVAVVAKGSAERRETRSMTTGLYLDVTVLPRGGDRFALLFHDMTARREAEEALRESQRRLEIATEAAALGIYDYDVRSDELKLDGRARKLWGIGRGERITYEIFLEAVHPNDRLAVRAAIEAALVMDGEEKFSVSHRVVRRRDGSVRWIQTSGRALFELEEGVRLVGTVEDITDRMRAEEALRKQEIEKAGRDERTRLARDLHDSVTQALFASTLRAEALASTPGAGPSRTIAGVEEVHRLNRGALAQMRSMLLELRGDPVADVPLEQLLRNVVEAAESRCSADFTLSLAVDGALPPEIHESIYRIAQEALTNVARHAGAGKVDVSLHLAGPQIVLRMQDDGRGFEVTSVPPGHFGLASMRERARETGADLNVESRLDEGTTVTVSWPVEAA
jgi:PAS domain S-box-containing protein